MLFSRQLQNDSKLQSMATTTSSESLNKLVVILPLKAHASVDRRFFSPFVLPLLLVLVSLIKRMLRGRRRRPMLYVDHATTKQPSSSSTNEAQLLGIKLPAQVCSCDVMHCHLVALHPAAADYDQHHDSWMLPMVMLKQNLSWNQLNFSISFCTMIDIMIWKSSSLSAY